MTQALRTEGPWAYKFEPPLDDWGEIRGPDGSLIAKCRSSIVSREELAAHRCAKTDPTAANARFIIEAVNAHEKLTNFLRAYDVWRAAEDAAAAAEDAPDSELRALCEAESTAQVELIKARAALSDIKGE